MKRIWYPLFTLFLTWNYQAGAVKPLHLCMPRGHEDLLNMAMLVARDNGLFKKHGVNVQVDLIGYRNKDAAKMQKFTVSDAGPVLPFNAEDWELTELILGKKKECDIAISPVMGMLATQKTDVTKLKPMYMTAYGTDYDTHLVVNADSPIKSVKDLKGKQIRVGQVPTHIALYQMLKKNDMKMSDVTLRFRLPSNLTAEALAKGEIDAAMTYVPTMPMMLASGKVRVLEQNIISKYVLPRTPNAILFTSAEFAKKNPEAVAKLKAAVLDTMEFINKNPVSVLKAATGYFHYRHGDTWKGWKTDPAQTERAAAFLGKLTVESFDDAKEASVAHKQILDYQNLLLELGYIERKIDVSPWFAVTTKQAGL